MNATAITGSLAKLFSATSKAADDLSGGLQQLRDRIADLQGQVAEVERTFVTKQEALRRVERWASRARAQGIEQLPLAPFMNPDGDGRLDFTPMSPIHHDVLVSVLADMMRERMAARIEREYDGGNCTSVTEAEREKRLAKLQDELTDLEITEERLMRTAERGGLPVLRRRDAPPLIVLAPDKALES